MGRTIFSVTHGVVSEDKKSWQFHQRGEADGRPRIIAEDKERGAERPELRQR